MESFSSLVSTGLLVLLLTAFVKVLTALSIMRYGLGLRGAGVGLTIFAISLAISLLIMDPYFSKLGGFERILTGAVEYQPSQTESVFRPFMERHADPEIVARLAGLANKLEESKAVADDSPNQPSFAVLTASFLVSELRSAFRVGFAVLLPFLVLDLLIANLLLLVGASQVPLVLVSLPVKLLLFISVDGWVLITEKLIGTYIGQ